MQIRPVAFLPRMAVTQSSGDFPNRALCQDRSRFLAPRSCSSCRTRHALSLAGARLSWRVPHVASLPSVELDWPSGRKASCSARFGRGQDKRHGAKACDFLMMMGHMALERFPRCSRAKQFVMAGPLHPL